MRKKICVVLVFVCLILNVPSLSFSKDYTNSIDYENFKYDKQLFYDELHQMIASQNVSHYFRELQMTMGSSTYTVDGEEKAVSPIKPARENNFVLGIQILSEVTGTDLQYDSDSESVLMTGYYHCEIQYLIESNTLLINGSATSMMNSGNDKESSRQMIETVVNSLGMELVIDDSSGQITVTSPYQTCRVLVWADHFDAINLDPVGIITDGSGLWVIQFGSPKETKNALEQLSREGVIADSDLFIPAVESKPYLTDSVLAGQGELMSDNGTFYNDLHEMISSQDESNYFGKMVMTIGSGHYYVDGKNHR